MPDGPDGADGSLGDEDASVAQAPPELSVERYIGGDGWVLAVGLTAEQHEAHRLKREHEEPLPGQEDRGMYRPIDITGYVVDGEIRYASLWHRTPANSLPWRMASGLTRDELTMYLADARRDGYRPVILQSFEYAGELRFSTVTWQNTDIEWEALVGLDDSTYQAEIERLTAADVGLTVTHVGAGAVGGEPRWSALLRKTGDVAWRARHGMTPVQYQAFKDEYARDDLRPAAVSPVRVGGRTLINALLARGISKVLRTTFETKLDDIEEQRLEGFRPERLVVHGSEEEGLYLALVTRHVVWSESQYEALETKARELMAREGTPGLSIAVSENGRLVYARAFGTGNLAAPTPLRTTQRMRVPGVSKTVTALGIMRLVEMGTVRLTDRVFGEGGVLGERYAREGEMLDPRVLDIRVEHLLEHTLGGWGVDDGSGLPDPAFAEPQRNRDELLSWVLRTQPLEAAPGTRYHYSNLGYVLLARIIEAASGQPYDTFLTEQVFERAEVDVVPATPSLSRRRDDEVVYHVAAREPTASSAPYQFDPTRLDGALGWLATPTEIVRLMLRADGLPSVRDSVFVDADTLQTMIAYGELAQATGGVFARGVYRNVYGNWWHGDVVPGSEGIMVRANNQRVWAAFTNGSPERTLDAQGLDGFMWDFLGAVPYFSNLDLSITPQ